MPNQLSRRTISRLALVAVDVLQEACRAGELEPAERTAIHELALGYLLLVGVTAKAQVCNWLDLLGHEGIFEQLSCRQSHSGVMLDGMRQRAMALGNAGTPSKRC